MPCLVFFLGDASLTMTPCSVFPFFQFFLNSPGPLRDLGQTRGAIDVCQREGGARRYREGGARRRREGAAVPAEVGAPPRAIPAFPDLDVL
jgi:hypothetical protein